MIKKIALGVFALVVLFLAFQIGMIFRTFALLDNAPEDYSYGAQNADLTMVEFIKYTCPHCRNIHPTVMEAVQRDGNIRYIPRPLPSQVDDAQMVYAAGKQGLFKLAHGALLRDERILDEGGLMAIAETLALDIPKLQKDMKSDEVQDMVNRNISLFLNVGGTRTPTFIIGGKIFFVPEAGMPSVEDFLSMFEEARK